MARCICTEVCDCQRPPPPDWDGKEGVFHVSEECPIHNIYWGSDQISNPEPHPDCRADKHKFHRPGLGQVLSTVL